LIIVLLSAFVFVLAYFAFLMGAKPVLDREITGQKATFSPRLNFLLVGGNYFLYPNRPFIR
jgi:hypothetical protein